MMSALVVIPKAHVQDDAPGLLCVRHKANRAAKISVIAARTSMMNAARRVTGRSTRTAPAGERLAWEDAIRFTPLAKILLFLPACYPRSRL